MKRFVSAIFALTAGAAMFAPSVSNALQPVSATDEGAFVRLVGDPSTGSVKFQYGWNAELADENPEGYWLGIYDVTNSHYVWAFDTNDPDPEHIPTWSLRPSLDLTQAMKRNAKPTEYLPNAEYKVVFFVRDAYGSPTTNLAEIELPFEVTNSST